MVIVLLSVMCTILSILVQTFALRGVCGHQLSWFCLDNTPCRPALAKLPPSPLPFPCHIVRVGVIDCI